MARRFSSSQRVALFLAAQGRCELCGDELQPGWHADHVIPWVRNGETDTANGQALCPACNLRKGSSMHRLPSWKKSLRNWQEEVLGFYQEAEKKDFMMVVTPAGGKTIGALRIAHWMLDGKIEPDAERLVVVVPSSNLRTQWAEAANSVGIDLDPYFENGGCHERSDYHGIVVTYQQVDAQPDLFRYQCSRHKTAVIFDEIHHSGDNRSWGESLRFAFDMASRRLLLSGTPFRSDNNPIPFVTYIDGKSQADFSYGYADALRDEIVRLVYFGKYDGELEWMSRDGRKLTATFEDKLNDRQAAERLNIALDPGMDWVPSVLREASDKLLSIRRTQQVDAAGLIVTKDIYHANAIARVLGNICGYEPVIITSDDPQATEKLKAFREGSGPWIVSVRMVSEGVDIPRLRVGVYLTNIITEMFFRQFVGRFLRVSPTIPQSEQTAHVFIPEDERIASMAFAIKEERDHYIDQMAEEALQDDEVDYEDEGEMQGTITFSAVPISAVARASGIIADGAAIAQDFIEQAKMLKSKSAHLAGLDSCVVALVIQAMSREDGVQTITVDQRMSCSSSRPRTKADERKALTRKGGPIYRLVNRLCRRTGFEQRDINNRLKLIQGKRQDLCSLSELKERESILQDWDKAAQQNIGQFIEAWNHDGR